MTWRARILAFAPMLALGLDLFALGHLVLRPSVLGCLYVVLAIYVAPLFLFRVLVALWPVEPERATRLDLPRYSPWWGAHKLQVIFETFPFFESALRLVPGLFSLWLRAWGSRVGRGVFWPPTLRVVDRSLVDIGDRVIFGHHVECVGHFVAKRNDGLLLFVKRLTIEDDVMVGTHVSLGPGVHLGRGSVIGAFSRLGPYVIVPPGTRVPAGTELVSSVNVAASSSTETAA